MVRPGYVSVEDSGMMASLTDFIDRLPLAGFTALRSSPSSTVRRVSAEAMIVMWLVLTIVFQVSAFLLQLTGSSIVSVS